MGLFSGRMGSVGRAQTIPHAIFCYNFNSDSCYRLPGQFLYKISENLTVQYCDYSGLSEKMKLLSSFIFSTQL